MIKKGLVILLLCIFVLQGVSATNSTTNINFKTPSFTDVHLTITSPADGAKIKYFSGTSNYYGDINFTYTGETYMFDLIIILKKGGSTIFSQKYKENYLAGNDLSFKLPSTGFEFKETPNASDIPVFISGNSSELTNETLNDTEVVNETIINETEDSNITTENTTSDKKSGISGFSILREDGSLNKSVYYIGGFILLLVLGFLAFKFIHFNRAPRIKVTKLSERQQTATEATNPKKDSGDVSTLISDAEARIKKAQEELSGIKKEQRIKEIRDRINKDKEELDGLSR